MTFFRTQVSNLSDLYIYIFSHFNVALAMISVNHALIEDNFEMLFEQLYFSPVLWWWFLVFFFLQNNPDYFYTGDARARP